jgi:hypothetical protein
MPIVLPTVVAAGGLLLLTAAALFLHDAPFVGELGRFRG